MTSLKHVFKVVPRAAAYDLHPGYMSTRMAMASGIERKIGVQHHHAHIASCMAENHLRGRFSAWPWMAPDLGPTAGSGAANFWLRILPASPGGPICAMSCFPAATRRCGSRGAWRSATCEMPLGSRYPTELQCFQGIDEKQVALVDTMLARRIQTVETSSCGRLFDAVAALLGVASEVTFEGQAAIALEAAAEPGIDERYDFEIEEGEPADPRLPAGHRRRS